MENNLTELKIAKKGGIALWFGLGAVLVAIVSGVLWGVLFSAKTDEVKQLAPVPTSSAIEDKWGIRISQIAVTADGGMVDFRFVILDPAKAFGMMSDTSTMPILATEDSKVYINSAAMMPPRHSLTAGTTYFLLYRNTKGAIKPNTPVTVLFNDELKLEHVTAW